MCAAATPRGYVRANTFASWTPGKCVARSVRYCWRYLLTSCLTITGVRTSPRPTRSSIARRIPSGPRSGVPVSLATLARRKFCARRCFGRSAGQISIATLGRFVTSTRPKRSRMSPRGAGTITSRCWFAWAVRRYALEFSTCSDQSRRKRSAKIVSITAPRTPARSIVCGVRRYGSSTRGSGAISRDRCAGGLEGPRRLAKETHLRGALERPAAAQRAPAEAEHGERQRDVHEDEPRQVDEHELPVRRLLQENLEGEGRDRDDHRRDGDGEVRRVRAVAAGRLAVAADPVAGRREHERRNAEDRAEGRDVDQEPRSEAGERAED